MENATICNEFEMKEVAVQDWINEVGTIIRSAVDVSAEATTIMSMTPKDGYQKKIDLIYSAEDMSTKEKIQAISHAEEKYAQDLERTSELCKGLMWVKVGVVLACIAGGVYLYGSDEGRKLMKSILSLTTMSRKECA